MSKKYVYLFSEGNATMRELLGGKGANLAEMTNLGLPVPAGLHHHHRSLHPYYEDGRTISPEIRADY
jgi:pyruvate,orthophosphate dikinase